MNNLWKGVRNCVKGSFLYNNLQSWAGISNPEGHTERRQEGVWRNVSDRLMTQNMRTHIQTNVCLRPDPSLQPAVINIQAVTAWCPLSVRDSFLLLCSRWSVSLWIDVLVCARPKPVIISYHLYFHLTEKPKLSLSDPWHKQPLYCAPSAVVWINKRFLYGFWLCFWPFVGFKIKEGEIKAWERKQEVVSVSGRWAHFADRSHCLSQKRVS